jgi:hypothetical protein
MLRRPKTLAVILAILASAVGAFGTYSHLYIVRDPSSEEYQVYAALLRHLATHSDWDREPSELALIGTTAELSTPVYEYPDSWIPRKLRHNRTDPSSEFVSFCGAVCASDFVRKNLAVWQLKSDVLSRLGISIAVPNESSGAQPMERNIKVTRVGFNLWHNRAVLMFSADCHTYSQNVPIMCIELGEAYLRKENGVWKVDHYQGLFV